MWVSCETYGTCCVHQQSPRQALCRRGLIPNHKYHAKKHQKLETGTRYSGVFFTRCVRSSNTICAVLLHVHLHTHNTHACIQTLSSTGFSPCTISQICARGNTTPHSPEQVSVHVLSPWSNSPCSAQTQECSNGKLTKIGILFPITRSIFKVRPERVNLCQPTFGCSGNI